MEGSLMKMLRSQGSIRCSALLIATIGAGLLQGCTRDPNVRKAKYLKSGEHYASEGKQQEAIIQYSNAIKIDHNYAAAHYDLAKSYLKMGAYAGGYAELMRTVELDPKNIQAKLDLGTFLLAAKQYPRSKDQANAVLVLQPNNADAIALLSSVALAQGDRAEALTQIQRALAIDPNRSNFHTALALIQSSDPAQEATAEAELQKAISLDPKNVMAHLVLSSLLQKKGDMQGARQQASTAVDLDPKNIRSRVALVGLELRANDKAAAEASLLQGTEAMADSPQGAELLWDYYARTGQVDQAASAYANLVSKHPKSVPLKVTYAHILMQKQDYAKAQSVSDDLMKTNSSDPQVAVLNGLLLLHAGKANDAFIALQKAEKNAPDNLPLKLLFAQSALAKGDLSDAEQSFQSAVRMDPNSMDASRGLAGVANQLGDFNLLMQVATTTLTHHPDSADAYLWKGIAEMHQQQAEQAAADFQTAIGKAPTDSAAMEELGALRLSQNKLPEGKKLEEEALAANPNDARALRILVAYYLHEKQEPQAITVVQQQITKSPTNGEMYDLLAELQLNAKSGPEALAAAQKAMQLNPLDAKAITLYTNAQVMQGNTPAAIATWKNWLNAHPTDAHADAVLGTLEEAQGDPNAAEDYYKKALANQPDQPQASNNLAYLMMERGQDIDVALSLAEAAHRGLPNSPSTADTLAWAYYNKGTYGSARDVLESVEKANPNDPSIEYHLGMIYSKLGDKSDAITHLKRASSLAPNSRTQKDADQALHTLGG
jgi:tetratricopeptide (TPR) repeat protein